MKNDSFYKEMCYSPIKRLDHLTELTLFVCFVFFTYNLLYFILDQGWHTRAPFSLTVPQNYFFLLPFFLASVYYFRKAMQHSYLVNWMHQYHFLSVKDCVDNTPKAILQKSTGIVRTLYNQLFIDKNCYCNTKA